MLTFARVVRDHNLTSAPAWTNPARCASRRTCSKRIAAGTARMLSPMEQYEAFCEAAGGRKVVRRILIANNGMAARKFILSVRAPRRAHARVIAVHGLLRRRRARVLSLHAPAPARTRMRGSRVHAGFFVS